MKTSKMNNARNEEMMQKASHRQDEDRKWEVLSSKYLFRRPWLTARVDRVKLPTDVINDEYYVLEYPDWVNTIAITKEGEFVLVRQYRHALGETRFELCGGVCEKGETPLEAAQRELCEETGFGKGTWRSYMTLSANASAMNNLTYCFVATDVERVAAQHLDKTEDLSVHLMNRKEVFQLLQADEFRQALMVAPLWKYFAITGMPE
jgi:8-oxo-dGTP pyrophosphatase MutT (NUDIX family)